MDILQNSLITTSGVAKQSYLNDSMFNQQWLKKFDEAKWWVSNSNSQNQKQDLTSQMKVVVQQDDLNGRPHFSPVTTQSAVDKTQTSQLLPSLAKRMDTPLYNHAMATKQTGSHHLGLQGQYSQSERFLGNIKKLLLPKEASLPLYEQTSVKDKSELSVRVYKEGEAQILNVMTFGREEISPETLEQLMSLVKESGFYAQKVIVNGNVVFDMLGEDDFKVSTQSALNKHY